VNAADADRDEAIAARAKAGDRGAFDALVRRHKDGIYRFVRRYVRNADDAYDILQSCFISAWQGLGRYDPARPFLRWLRTIALNKCRDFGRRQAVRGFILRAFALERAEDPGTVESDPDAERLARMDRAIADLPAFYKEPLLLTVVSGLSHQETADLLKSTPKAVEMRLYRARHKIKIAMHEKTAEEARRDAIEDK